MVINHLLHGMILTRLGPKMVPQVATPKHWLEKLLLGVAKTLWQWGK